MKNQNIKTGDDNDLEAGRVGDDGEQYMTDFFQGLSKKPIQFQFEY